MDSATGVDVTGTDLTGTEEDLAGEEATADLEGRGFFFLGLEKEVLTSGTTTAEADTGVPGTGTGTVAGSGTTTAEADSGIPGTGSGTGSEGTTAEADSGVPETGSDSGDNSLSRRSTEDSSDGTAGGAERFRARVARTEVGTERRTSSSPEQGPLSEAEERT